MDGKSSNPKCLACGQDSSSIPLLPLEYQGRRLWICACSVEYFSPRALHTAANVMSRSWHNARIPCATVARPNA